MGLQFGSRWLLNIFLLTSLGDKDFGIFAFIYSIANFSIAILPFGSQTFLIKSGNNPEKAKLIFQQSLASSYLLFCIAIVFFYLIDLFIDQPYGQLLYLGIILGFFFSINTIVFTYLKALGSFKFDLLINLIFSLLIGVIIGLTFIDYPINIAFYFYALIFINFFTTFLCFLLSKDISANDLIESIHFKDINIFRSLNERGYYGFQDILTATFVQGGMLIMPLLISEELYGKYRGILLITAPFALINVAVSQVLLQNITGKSLEEIKSFFHKLQLISIPALLLILCSLFYFRETILKIISKISLTEETQVAFIIISLMILFSFIYSGYEMVIVALNRQKYRFWIMFLGAITNIISIYLLLPKYGLIGALLTNLISSVIVVISMAYIAEKFFRKQTSI
ncbi:lipopolysaccharide biosynthesis protein [Mesonia ostreae]|uniref:Polysaccharide biosynthesis C-terminal domain-containing protein n=1 Tax=Mesonia ostreae TaxID=861110 RepID=A0ABU2KIZ2_9FLAO|nr:polysaccharide biosynthesis C-terminal domain-containing protein [Mesonia ostreae]MDT0294658.1 polysaccharide biosynthesis C-terminal domain-containing protein [Mesonia ostreae]